MTFENTGAPGKRSHLSVGDWESVAPGSCSPGGAGEWDSVAPGSCSPGGTGQCGDFLEDDTLFAIVGSRGAEFISAE